jgi:hypothetical protein
MKDVVQSAATASMPMTKFMEIFKSVIPNVELYQNRLEELTGTIKLLSKTMSPKDVKRFMDAFSKGFSGMDFKQRLKTVMITGADKVKDILGKGFSSRAREMAEGLKDSNITPEEFDKAFRGGEKAMAALMAKAQASGKVTGTQIGEAMKLASYEKARQGGPLELATALRGAGLYDTYSILKEQSQTFVKGFDGLSEHVIQMTGITEDQYLAMRDTQRSMEFWGAEIDQGGMTHSKSLNAGIEKRLIPLHKTMADWKTLSKQEQERILFEASQEHDTAKNAKITAEDLAQEQVTATTSVSDKIENIIAFLLEKLFSVMQPLLDLVDDIWRWLTGTEDQKKMIKEVQNLRDITAKGYEGAADEHKKSADEYRTAAKAATDPKEKKALLEKAAAADERASKQMALAEEMKIFSAKVQKSIEAGMSTEDIAAQVLDPRTVAEHMTEAVDIVGEEMGALGKANLTLNEQAMWSRVQQESATAKAAGGPGQYTAAEMDFMTKHLGKAGMGNIMKFGGMQAPSAEAAERAQYKGATRRIGTEEVTGPKNIEERKKQELEEQAADFEVRYKAAIEAGKPPPTPPPGVTGKLAAANAGPKKGYNAPKTAAEWAEQDRITAGLQSDAPGARGATTAEFSEIKASKAEIKAKFKAEREARLMGTEGAPDAPDAALTGPLKKVTVTGPTGQPEEKPKATDPLAAIKEASESINTQVMGISMHLDDIKKILRMEGITINKNKFQPIIDGSFKPMLTDVVATELMNYFLYAGDTEHIREVLGYSKGNSDVKTVSDALQGWSQSWLNDSGTGRPFEGIRDFGGKIDTTGYYRLMKGEEVVNPNLNGGGGSKSVTINATINVDGAQDPEFTASVVKRVLYEMAEKP